MLHRIGQFTIGADAPVFVIAEIGLNHGGSLDRAVALIDGAAQAGASAIKLQTLLAAHLVAPSCPAPPHVQARSLREFFAQFELSLDAHRLIVKHARARGLAVMTTPFTEDVIPALDRIGFDAYKIASGDLTYDGLIAAAARTGQPLVISTGMSSIAEVRHALQVAEQNGNHERALLHCVSAYPVPRGGDNLRAIRTLAGTFRLPTGLSDHGNGLVSAAVAVALGACIYERHLVLEGDEDAIDRPVSSTPNELRAIIAAMEQARISLGSGAKVCQPAEAGNVTASRRGLYASRRLRAGDVIGAGDVIALRPANELPPSRIGELIGVELTRDLAAGTSFVLRDLGEKGDRHPPHAGAAGSSVVDAEGVESPGIPSQLRLRAR